MSDEHIRNDALDRKVRAAFQDAKRELFRCDVCRFQTYYLRCKYECPNCGARRDCSDP